MKVSLPIDSGFYESPSSTLSNRICSNLFPTNPMEDGGVSSGGLTSMPGRTGSINLPDGAPRGTYFFNGFLYVIRLTGTSGLMYKVLENDSYSLVATMSGVGGDVPVVTDNGVTMCIVWPDQAIAFFYDDINGAVEITDSVFAAYQAEAGGVRSVCFIDGFFIFNTYTTLFKSSLVTTNDGKNFDALDFVQPFLREKAQKVLSVRGELMVFGDDTSKFYSNVGGSDFPFQEIPGATIQKGIEGERNALEFDNGYFFVGSGREERPAVWRGIGGGGVTKVSTDAIDALNISGDINIGGFMLDGRPFVCISANSDTVFYDILSSSIKGKPVWGKWTYGSDESPVTFEKLTEAYDKIYIDDSRSKLSYLDFTRTGDDVYGDSISRFSTQYIHNQSDGIFVNRVELHMETGASLDPNVSLSDTDVSVLMEYSDDGGRTWKSAGTRKLGKYQKYGQRLVWKRLGRAPTSRNFKFTCTTNIPLNFNRVDLDIEGGQRA